MMHSGDDVMSFADIMTVYMQLVSVVYCIFSLFSLLFYSSVSVVRAASECLPRVLTTKAAATVLSKLEDMYDWTKFLHPFKPHKKKVFTKYR